MEYKFNIRFIKWYIKTFNLTEEQLCEFSGISVSNYKRILKNDMSVPVEDVLKLANYIGVLMDVLIRKIQNVKYTVNIDLLCKAMKQQDYSKMRLCLYCGIGMKTFDKIIENDVEDVDVNILLKIANILKIDFEDLVVIENK